MVVAPHDGLTSDHGETAIFRLGERGDQLPLLFRLHGEVEDPVQTQGSTQSPDHRRPVLGAHVLHRVDADDSIGLAVERELLKGQLLG